MTSQLATILKEILSQHDNGLDREGAPLPTGLRFIDKMAGLVVVGDKAQPTDVNGAFAVSKFPISLDSDYQQCITNGCYKDLVPNSKFKGILYFEDFGTFPKPNQSGRHLYTSKLRLVCWINNKLIQGSNCKSINHILITMIREELESKSIFNYGEFARIKITTAGIIENDPKLFLRYTYPEESVKFLMHPYEAFGIDLNIDYSISPSCIEELVLNPELC